MLTEIKLNLPYSVLLNGEYKTVQECRLHRNISLPYLDLGILDIHENNSMKLIGKVNRLST